MKFQYDAEPTLHETIGQAMGYASMCWSRVENAGVFDSTLCRQGAWNTIEAVRDIVASELTRLLDSTGTAKEWNDAIETALVKIEALR